MKHYVWSAVQRFGTQIVSFLGNILIARILTPDDYGLVAMLAIFMSIAMNFTESGFADYLIRNPKSDKQDFSVVFVHNIVFSIVIYTILYFSAPWIAEFYDRSELVAITRVLGLGIVFRSISLSEFTRLRKSLDFKKLAIIQIFSAFFSVMVGYLLALNGFSYWALIAQILVQGIITIVMLIVLREWKSTLYFDMEKYKAMRKFGNHMIVSYFTNQIGANLYNVFIAKFYNSQMLGFYNQADKINKISFQSINGIILTTSYSLLANEKDRARRLEMYKRLLNQFLLIHFTLSMLLIAISRPLLGFVYGEQWLPTAPLLQLLLISFLFQPIINLNANIVKIENKPHVYRNLTFLRNGLMLLALMVTYSISIEVIMLGQIIARMISSVVGVLVCGKYIGFFPYQQLKISCKQLIAPGVALAVVYLVVYQLVPDNYFMSLILFSLSFVLVFVGVNVLIKNDTFYDLCYKFKIMLKRKI